MHRKPNSVNYVEPVPKVGKSTLNERSPTQISPASTWFDVWGMFVPEIKISSKIIIVVVFVQYLEHYY